MEFNKPVSNPMLVGAIEVMKADPSPDHKNLFINEMMKAKFLAPAIIDPAPETGADGQPKLTPGSKIQFPMLTAPDGKNYFMAFTDKMELKLWKDEEGIPVFALAVDDYAGMTLRQGSQAAGFVINPYGGNIVIAKEMLGALMAAKLNAQKPGQNPGQGQAAPQNTPPTGR